ncbi:MAG: hypothetical protein OHK0039_18050 [Bacteroidia bacterium]
MHPLFRTRWLALLFVVLSGPLSAQNASRPWAVSVGANLLQYRAHPGKNPLVSMPYQPGLELGFNKYLNGAFDFRTRVNLGYNLSYPSWEGLIGDQYLIDMSYQLAFKFYNGLFFRESVFVAPYVLAGVGGSYVPNHPDAYIPLGGGVRFRINHRASVHVESTRKLSLNEDVQQLSHAIAFVYNLNAQSSPPVMPGQELDGELLISQLLPPDRDLDGVIDAQDLCPDEAGTIAYDGCPTYPAQSTVAAQDPSQVPEPDTLPIATVLDATYTWDAILDDSTATDVAATDPEATDPPVTPGVDAWYADKQTIEPEALPELPQDAQEAATDDWTSDQTSDPIHPDPAQPDIAQPDLTTPEPAIAEETWETWEEEAAPEEAPASLSPVSPRRPAQPCAAFADGQIPSVYFAYASDQLNDEAKAQLALLAEALKTCTNATLVLEGHTDDTGTERNNLVLSIMRAYNVKYHLVYHHGISQQRIVSRGLGERKPLAKNATPTGRDKNRRVDFMLVKTGEL